MINTIIFDMDGLMIDSEKVYYQSYKELIEETGREFTLDNYKAMLGQRIEGDMKSMTMLYGEDFPSEEIVLKALENAKQVLVKGPPLKKGLIELLEYLKDNNYTCVVATSTIESLAKEMLKSTNIYSYFDYGIFGNDVENGKPHPEVFLKASKGKKKEECLILEDSEKGIEAAYRAGIDVICVPDLKYPDKKYEDMTIKIVDSLLDVLNYLK